MAYRPKDIHQRILHRLKITSGQLKKVLSMAEEDAYCIDILHQSGAVQKALKEIDNLILENHLKGCVVESIQKGNSGEAVAEVMNVFKKRG